MTHKAGELFQERYKIQGDFPCSRGEFQKKRTPVQVIYHYLASRGSGILHSGGLDISNHSKKKNPVL